MNCLYCGGESIFGGLGLGLVGMPNECLQVNPNLAGGLGFANYQPPKSKLDVARAFLKEVEARHPERKVVRK